MNELPRMLGWLHDQLAPALAELAVAFPDLIDATGPHEGAVPEDVADDLVAIVYQHQAPSDDVRGPAHRVMARGLFVVRASVAGASYDPLEPVADAIDAALEGVSAAGADDTWLQASRVSTVGYPEFVGPKQFRNLGGLYRLWCHAT